MQPSELHQLRDKLRQDLAEAEAALPYHSARPWQVQRVEDAEERLAEVEKQIAMLEDES